MKPFQKKSKDKELEPKKTEQAEETSLVDPDYNRNKLFKKGVNLMADEKLEEAAVIFEQALRIDPNNIETLMKLGYARFHLEEYNDAIKIYDKILDIDVTNPEAWNLKALVHYEQKNYSKALDAVEKAVESDQHMEWHGTTKHAFCL